MSKDKSKGLFITLEGIEGAGKSTHISFLENYFTSRGRQVVLTREPGGTDLGEAIRSTLLSNEYKNKISEDTELLLMFASRAQHLSEIIEPALKNDHVVICDRFTDSSFAYQGGGRGIEMNKIERLRNWVQGNRQPDLTLLFDLPVELGLERADKRSQADRFESEAFDFFQAVRECYLQRAKAEPERFSVIDATKSIEEIQTGISQLLDEQNFRH